MDDYTCECTDGYEGDDCEDEINECVPNPCHHAGVCTVRLLRPGIAIELPCRH